MKAFLSLMVASLVLFGCVYARPLEDTKVDLKAAKVTGVDGKESELVGYNEGDEKVFFYTNGKLTANTTVKEDGKYKLVVKASCDSANKERAKFTLSVAGKEVKKDFELTEDDAKEYSFDVEFKKGDTKIVVEFTNDKYKEGEYDLNMYVYEIKYSKQ